MKEQFDKKLAEKIKASFENHEEAADPREWEKFSDAFFSEKKAKKAVIWPFILAGAAACLVLGFVIFPFIDQEADFISQTEEVYPSQENVDTARGSVTDERPAMEPLASADFPAQVKEKTQPLARAKQVEFAEDFQIAAVLPALTLDEPELKPLNLGEIQNRSNPMAFAPIINSSQEQEKDSSPLISESEAKKLLDNWAMADAAEPVRKEKSNSMKLGVLVAPQANSNTSMGLNLGGGIMSEIPLSKRLKLDVGVTYARHNMVPHQNQRLMEMSGRNPGSGPMVANTTRNASPMMASMAFSNDAQSTYSYELSFTNLDIPVNLKYKVMDRPQTGLYIISGLSSMVFLNQSTTETFSTSFVGLASADALATQPSSVVSSEIRPDGVEGSVDLGRMLNFSFGYEHNLSNGTFLSVEPFYKIPIGNMTFIDQQFSIGGINLRMNFQFKK
jgi:hypothetical protein